MANESAWTGISSLVNIIQEGAYLTAREQGVMAALVTNFTGTGMELRKNYAYTGGTLVDPLYESVDLAAQAFTPAILSTLTPAQVGAQYFFTDLRIASDWLPVAQDAARDLGSLIGSAVDTALCGNFSDVTGATVRNGTIGAAGTTITWGHFMAMRTKLRAAMVPEPYSFVVHPNTYHRLAAAVAPAATVTNSPWLQDEVARRWFVGNMMGVDVFVDANITVDGNDDAPCLMFNREALALDVRRALRLETQRDASRAGGGYELNATMVFAHGVWRPSFAQYGLFDAAAPTS